MHQGAVGLQDRCHGGELAVQRKPGDAHRPSLSTRTDKGSATAELVLLTPLLMLVALFAVATGRLVAARLEVNDAAHQAARAASIARTPSAADAAARSAVESALGANRLLARAGTSAWGAVPSNHESRTGQLIDWSVFPGEAEAVGIVLAAADDLGMGLGIDAAQLIGQASDLVAGIGVVGRDGPFELEPRIVVSQAGRTAWMPADSMASVPASATTVSSRSAPYEAVHGPKSADQEMGRFATWPMCSASSVIEVTLSAGAG
ncbi:TadE/TadG family type IV pilus assembly protein [Microtetraspora malaysiensis]|uniref:TadE/TadG family type IV pilus assembly protein n=1 Tax=Microtetraspora malaysiensis TaxID=161358 RepID=UPI003D8F5B6A